MTSDGTIYGRAVAEIYNKLSTMTEGVTALCAPSPTLFATTANMMCEAAEEAIKTFRAENPRHGHRIQ